MPSWFCDRCGGALAENARFCSSCGVPLAPRAASGTRPSPVAAPLGSSQGSREVSDSVSPVLQDADGDTIPDPLSADAASRPELPPRPAPGALTGAPSPTGQQGSPPVLAPPALAPPALAPPALAPPVLAPPEFPPPSAAHGVSAAPAPPPLPQPAAPRPFAPPPAAPLQQQPERPATARTARSRREPGERRRPTATLAAAVVAIALAGGGLWAANTFMPEAEPPEVLPSGSSLHEVALDTSAGPRDLVSASGDLWCHFESALVQCAVESVTWSPPAPACPESAAAIAVSLAGARIGYPCVTAFSAASEVLERNVRYVSGSHACTLASSTGVICTNQDGVGFEVGADIPLRILP